MSQLMMLRIQSGEDRERMVIALANSGYTVKVVEKDDPKKPYGTQYFVAFEGEVIDERSDQ